MRVSDATSSLMGGDEQWPPGFRFHPTDEELVLYYLKRKICGLRLKLDAIAEVDVYKANPEDLPPLSKLKTGDRQWFFFSPRDRKYPSGGRSNRATRLGYWKATGKDRPVTCSSRSVGIKKTLVFYRGRAPSGERTDWVMHEYTIDEEELKRSPVQDYYALYKIYKKSGPGPKNGEQYGAPFREEDWADDDEKAIDSVGQQHDVSFDSIRTNCPSESQLNGLDVLLNRPINDPLSEPISEPCGAETTLVERNLQERAIVLPPCGQLNGAQSCFNSTQLKSTQFQEISEVPCANNVIRQGSQESDKDFIEDFLEIDDLFGPEPTQQNTVNNVDLRIEDFDGLCELDLFENGSMFLQDIDNTEPSFYTYNNDVMNEISNPVPASCPNNFDNGVVNQVSNSYFNNYPSEMVQPISQPHYTVVDNEMVNQFNYEISHDNDVADQRWMPTPIAPNQGSVIPPTPGVVSGGLNQNQSHIQNQTLNQNGEVIEGEESWLSSSLWTFLETIPTTPASATERTALVNNAFERLSSFGKMGDNLKISLLGRNATAGDPNATHRRYRNWYSRGVMFFSFLVLLFAILWVFTETSVRVLVSL